MGCGQVRACVVRSGKESTGLGAVPLPVEGVGIRTPAIVRAEPPSQEGATPLCPPASAVIGPGPYQLLDELVANRFASKEPLKQQGTAHAGVLLGVDDDARRLQQ